MAFPVILTQADNTGGKMKTIGLIGGMSWESTETYYSIINSEVNRRLGQNHSAKCILYSVDFQEIEALQYSGDWAALERLMLDAGEYLKRAGAEFLVVCTNTMHKVVGKMEEEVGVPLLHIGDAVGEAVRKDGKKTVGLLGTIFTMEEDFYRARLEEKFGLTVLVPDRADMDSINTIIFKELVKGIITESSRGKYVAAMEKMRKRGAEGIILGCTEIGSLITKYELPLYDSTILHAKKAAEYSISMA